jgi:hypothetical protein
MNKAMGLRMRSGLAIAFLVMTFCGMFADAGVNLNFDPNDVSATDSTTWERCYEANVLPVQDGWVNIWGHDLVGGVGSIVPFDAGDPNGPSYLHTDNDDDYQGFRWQDIPGDFDPNTNDGISIEWRMRAVAGESPFFNHLFASGPQKRWLTTYVTQDSVTLRSADDPPNYAAPEDPNDPAFNDPGFFIYRVTCDNSDWRLYRYKDANDPNRAVSLLTAPVLGVHAVVVLDGTGYMLDFYGETFDAVYDIDYIRWTNYGALPPGVPEVCGDPGTLYLQADLNTDCYVDEDDLKQFSARWLNCTDPDNPLCD